MLKNCLFGLFVCSSLFSQATIAQEGELPKRLIPASTVAALFAQPKAILHTPSMELAPREVITVTGLQQFGFDPCEIQQAMLLVDSFSNLQNPPGFALVITFGQPQEPGAQLTANFKKEKLDSRTIYRMNPEAPAILQYDPATLIFGMEPFIQKMLTAKNAESPLIDLIHREKGNSHLSAFLTMKSMRGTINDDLLGGVGPLPPPLNGLLELPDLIDSLAASIDYSDAQRARLQITAVDEAAGKQIANLFDRCIRTGRQMLMATMAADLSDQNPAMRKAIEQYMNRVGDYLEANIRPQHLGKQVVFEATGENGQLTNIAMMGTLTGLLLPAVQQAREAARRTQAVNQLRQIALAHHNYHDVYGHFPTDILDADGQPLLSWRVAILPFMEQQALYEQFHLDEPWNSEHNLPLLKQMPESYQSANVPSESRTVFLRFTGMGTPFEKTKPKFVDCLDGTSNTIMAVEANADLASEWSRPGDIPFQNDQPVSAVGQLRPGGFNAVFCDGAAHFLPNTISQELLKNLIQASDGNIVRFPYNE